MIPLRTPLNVQPHQYLGDTAGRPLDYGRVYFGEVNKDPEFYPINVFYDEQLINPAPQPVRTKGGFLNANGDMTEIYAQELLYSVKVLDQYGREVFYKADASRKDYTEELRAEFDAKEVNIVNVKRFGIIGNNSDITTQLMQIIADNPTYTKYYFPDGAYSLSGFLLEKDGIELIGQSKSGTVFNVTQGSNGISFRCGKRGGAADTRPDNMPVFNGVNPVFIINDYSPATTTYPRYKDIRVDNITINLIGNMETGFSFYRIDGGGYDINITFEGSPTIGNAVRTYFCTNLWIPELNTSDNLNATYNTFFYWSYGVKGRKWVIGKAAASGLEFKHGVNCQVDEVVCRGGNNSFTAEYGSRDITINSLIVLAGSARISASEEFDIAKNIHIKDLRIDNPTGTGLVVLNADSINIDRYYIKALVPLEITYTDFYMFSTDTSITPNLSTGKFTYTGNHDNSKPSSGMTKYFESRNAPSLSNSKFGKGVLDSTGSSHIVISSPGGATGVYSPTTGKVIRNKVPTGRGYNESLRTSYRYDDDLPRVIKNVDFGEMELFADTPTAAVTPMIFSNPIQGCTGRFLLRNAPFTVAQIYLMFDSSIDVICDKVNTGFTYPFTIYTMVNSKISGSMKPSGRAFLFKSSTTLYQDGFINHAISMTYAFPAAPTTTPIIQTENVATTWRSNIDLSGSRVLRTDGVPIGSGANRIVLHTTTHPATIDQADGGMYSQDALIDFKEPFRRTFAATTGVAPTIKPNYVGELAKNSTLDEWYRAKNLTGWTAL